MSAIHDQYFHLLNQAAFSLDLEDVLTASADLGRDFLSQEIPPEDVAELHHKALVRLTTEYPELKLIQFAERLLAPLREISLIYRLVFRQQLEQKCMDMMSVSLARSSRLESIGTLAAGIAHDFNSILGIINGYAELLIDDFPDDSIGRGNAQHIITASFRARDLIIRMLAFARQGPVDPIDPIPVEAVALVKNALEMMQVTLAPGINMTFDTELQNAWILADPSQIHQIVMNLCMNSADAMNGQGTLDIRIKRAPLLAGAGVSHEDRFCLVVADNGCGMPLDVQQRAFDPFYTTKAPGKGSGLGLSIVYGIVSDLSGEIDIQSRVGAGCKLNIYLPLIEQDSPGPVQEEYRAYALKEEDKHGTYTCH